MRKGVLGPLGHDSARESLAWRDGAARPRASRVTPVCLGGLVLMTSAPKGVVVEAGACAASLVLVHAPGHPWPEVASAGRE